jgi:hypothetical protein
VPPEGFEPSRGLVPLTGLHAEPCGHDLRFRRWKACGRGSLPSHG